MEKKRWIVLGLGASGRSALRFLTNRESSWGQVVGVDDQLSIDEELNAFANRGVLLLSSCPSNLLKGADALVKSPGISPGHPLVLEARAHGIPVIGDIELVAKIVQGVPCIGVTGTNGKTTVTLLIEHILRHAGLPFRACGNVGVPICDMAMTFPDEGIKGLVVELSSYQLETLSTPFLDAALLLNITPDHLDRYSSFEEYRKAKLRIFSLLKEKGEAIVHSSIPIENESCIMRYGFRSAEIFAGYSPHDADNIEAAFLACKHFGLSDDQMKDALFTFKKPLHRIEFVCNIQGVSFFNDSKGTNIDAVIKAVDTMNGQVVLIAGGVDKGSSYTLWKKSFADKVKMICAIGQAAPKMKKELGESIPVHIFDGLHSAVAFAAAQSEPGGNVLLSPGCASFDMFRDYRHRGDEFKRIVLTIGESREYEPS